MNMTVVAQKVQIETSDENLRKLSDLFKTLQYGGVNGQNIRPPMQVTDMARVVGVSRKTISTWRNGDEMPQPGNLRSIAKNLLRVKESDLAAYFAGNLTLKQLLSIKPKSATPDEIYQNFQTLAEPDKDVVLSLLLRDRALQVGKSSFQKRNKVSKNGVSSSHANSVSEDTINMASSMGEGLSPHASTRLRILLIQSRQKHSDIAGRSLDLIDIAERSGILSNSYNVRAIAAAERGEIGEIYGERLFPPEWEVIGVICFEPTGWNGDSPISLSNRTYKGRVDALKKSLTENGEPRPA